MGVSDFEGDEKRDCLNRVVTSIDIITFDIWSVLDMLKEGGKSVCTHEKIVGIWVGTANSEQLHQIMELAMYISAYCDWTFLVASQSLFGRSDLSLLTTGCTLDSSCKTSRAYSTTC